MLRFFLLYFKLWFIPVIAKLHLQEPLLQFLVSHDASEIILICRFAAQKTFIFSILVESMIHLVFLMNRRFKRTAFMWNIHFLTM